MEKKFVIISSNEVDSVDFSQVLENSAETLRFSLDATKTFVKFSGGTPDFLSGKQELSYAEMQSVLATEDWSKEIQPETV